MTHLTIADHVLFALIALVLPVIAVFRVRPQSREIPSETGVKIRLYWVNSALLWVGALIVGIAWFLGGHDPVALGFRLPLTFLMPEWIILISMFCLFYMTDTFVGWNEKRESEGVALMPATYQEFLHFGTIVSISAGFCEEVIFRGFLITYLVQLLAWTDRPHALAIGISAVIFAAVHAYQGWQAMLKIAMLTLLFGGIFVLSQSLVPVVILHFLVDLLGGWLSYQKVKVASQQPREK